VFIRARKQHTIWSQRNLFQELTLYFLKVQLILWRLDMGLTVRGLNPGGGGPFRTRPVLKMSENNTFITTLLEICFYTRINLTQDIYHRLSTRVLP
jgi:hypothetical protein